jgi:hypothetical protein
MTDATGSASIPLEQAEKIRVLSHDLSNALEIIIQTSYLIGLLPLDENGRQWRQMLDQGVQQAAKINRDLRDYVHKNS